PRGPDLGPLPNAGGGPRPRGGGPGSSSSPRTGPPGWPRSRTAAGRSRRDMTNPAPRPSHRLVIMAIRPTGGPYRHDHHRFRPARLHDHDFGGAITPPKS